MKKMIIVATLVLIGCAGKVPSYVVNGVAIYAESPAAWLHDGTNSEKNFQRTLDVAFAYWESWGYARPDVPIEIHVVSPDQMPVGIGGLTTRSAVGWRINIADNAGPASGCIEGLAIPHEIGHVMGAPPDHSGESWADLGNTLPLLLPYCP